jgi:hypothetical protein
VSTALSAVLVLAFGLVDPSVPDAIVAAIALGAAFFVIGWNGVFIVALAEAGPIDHVNMYLGTGLTMMRIGNIVAPPVFGVLLALIVPAAAWAVVAAVLGAAALGFVLVGPGPVPPEPETPIHPDDDPRPPGRAVTTDWATHGG